MLRQIENSGNFQCFPVLIYYVALSEQFEHFPQKQGKKQTCFDRESQIKLKFVEQIKNRHQRSTAKEWSQEQDELLLKLGSNNSITKTTVKRFHDKNYEVCLRRYRKLIRNQQKWPIQDDRTIRNLRDNEDMSWTQIRYEMKKYSVKEIRERYRNFLQTNLKRQKWTIQEDLLLWNKVYLIGKKWKNICLHLPGRTQLQLRNRYYKFLLPIAKRIEEQFAEKDPNQI